MTAKKAAAKRTAKKGASRPKKTPTKRTVAKRTKAATPAPEPGSPAMQKLDALGIAEICARVTDGQSMTKIAKDACVSFGSLATWLEATPERSARAREARQLAARMWDEQALDAIENSSDGFSLSRAKEKAHHLRWRAAKIAPREYGDKLGLGAAHDLPPLPPPSTPAQVSVSFEISPGDAYKQMLARQKA